MNLAFVEHQFVPQFLGQTTETSFVLMPSAIAGVGVFALHGIKEGTLLHLFAEARTRFISHEEARSDRLLEVFCKMYGTEAEDGGYWVAPNFNQQSVGWYLNHSTAPNAQHDERWEYLAVRDIQAGEEITIDYGKI